MHTSHAAAPVSRTNRVMRGISRLTVPLGRPLAGRRGLRIYAVVHHTGRRSGTAYAVPVAIERTADGFVIPLPFGDATQWLRNVQAAGGCRVRWNGRDYAVTEPVVIDRAAASPAFGRIPRAVLGVAGMDAFLRLRDAGECD